MTYGHLRGDCLYTGISSRPNARYRVWESLYLYLTLRKGRASWHLSSHAPSGGVKKLKNDSACMVLTTVRFAPGWVRCCCTFFTFFCVTFIPGFQSIAHLQARHADRYETGRSTRHDDGSLQRHSSWPIPQHGTEGAKPNTAIADVQQ